jgi:hypothetical protein
VAPDAALVGELMLDNLKIYGCIGLIILAASVAVYVKILRDRNAGLTTELVVKEAELAAQERATQAVEAVAQEAAERAASLQPIRVEVQSAPVGGCTGPAVRAALRGLRERQASPVNPGQP